MLYLFHQNSATKQLKIERAKNPYIMKWAEAHKKELENGNVVAYNEFISLCKNRKPSRELRCKSNSNG